MEYKFFDKQFLVMPDDKDIIYKQVFYADNLDALIREVERGDFSRTITLNNIVDSDYCFEVNDARWCLAYYDPNYECKVAHSQGKQIQYKTSDGEWVDATPHWVKGDEYRVKPDTWYVHPSADEYGNCIGHPFYKDTSNKTFVAFEGTEAECDAWIAEHTPKTRRMTNRELAMWCADSKGQFSYTHRAVCFVAYAYANEDDAEVEKGIIIREWDSDEWHEPLVEVKA